MERNVVEVAWWLLVGFQLKQANLRNLGVCQNWRACWHILSNQFFSIHIVQDLHDVLAQRGKVLCLPIVSGTPRPSLDLLRITVSPDSQSSLKMQSFEQAVGLSLSGRLRKLAVVAPCSEIRSRYIWHYAGTFLGDEKAAGSRQEIRMVVIPPIEKVYDAMVNVALSKQSGF